MHSASSKRVLAKAPQASDERMRRLEEDQAKTQTMLADVVDSIKRLERIAWTNSLTTEELEAKIQALEARQRKPQ